MTKLNLVTLQKLIKNNATGNESVIKGGLITNYVFINISHNKTHFSEVTEFCFTLYHCLQ